MPSAPQFKENTGFCIRCGEWKLLVIEPFKEQSLYCLRCDKELSYVTMAGDGDTCVRPQGHHARILAHTDRVQKELADIKEQEEAQKKETHLPIRTESKFKSALRERHLQRRRAS